MDRDISETYYPVIDNFVHSNAEIWKKRNAKSDIHVDGCGNN